MTDAPSYTSGENNIERISAMMRWTPQSRALGIELVRAEGPRVWGKAPYRPEFVGDPDTGVIAGGVLTTLLDQVCGLAVTLALKEPTIVATIDLRIDYMRAAEPGRDIIAEAHCYKTGRNVAFVRALAYEDSAENPIANATSAFMVNLSRSAGANLRERKKK